MKRSRLAGGPVALATLLALGACEGLEGDPLEGEAIAFTASEAIAPVGTSNPVTVRNWNWNGTAADLTLADGNVTNPTGKYTLTYKVTPAGITNQRTLSVTREEATGKLRLVAQEVVLIYPDLQQITSRSTLDITPYGGMVMTRWRQGQPTITCPNGQLGPFVVDSGTCYEPLFDQRTLSRLPAPRFFNGTPTSQNWIIAWAAASAYQLVYADHLLLWDTFRYRANLMAPTVNRNTVYGALAAFLNETGYGLHHGDINHGTVLGDSNEDWTDLGHHAGFLDGHRAYMFLAEEWLTSPPNLGWVIPFRRTPSWLPTTVPPEFDRDSIPDVAGRDVTTTAGGPGVRTGDRHATICTTYNTRNTPRMTGIRNGGASINDWHGPVHVHFGGHFRDIAVTANTPLFWVWHTTVDSVWANLQRCYVDDGDSL